MSMINIFLILIISMLNILDPNYVHDIYIYIFLILIIFMKYIYIYSGSQLRP